MAQGDEEADRCEQPVGSPEPAPRDHCEKGEEHQCDPSFGVYSDRVLEVGVLRGPVDECRPDPTEGAGV